MTVVQDRASMSPPSMHVKHPPKALLSLCLSSLVVLAALLDPGGLASQETSSISGQVVNTGGAPAPDAEVWIVETNLRTSVDGEGRFTLEGLASGSYLVQATSPRWGRAVERLDLGVGVSLELTFTLEPLRELDEIVVSASPRALRGFEVAQALSVISGSDLATRAASSLGETLANEPGVSSSYFGPGSSRPLIRGLGGDRVRILEGGIGVGDASATSPDHAVSIEPRSAQRIEVVRGPATLLYGSSAIGGVVNVIDGRIPSEIPSTSISGYAEGLGGTVSDELTGQLDLTTSAGALVFHGSALTRGTDDYAIPGFARTAEPGGPDRRDGERYGLLENSWVETTRGDIGASLVGEEAYFGVSFGGLDTSYGVPGYGRSDGETTEGEEGPVVSIDLENRRWDLAGEWRREGETLDRVKLRLGAADYEHRELEGREVGTRFLNDSWEGRFELDHRFGGGVSGAVGAQLSGRDFEAIGPEAFVPPTTTYRLGVFTFEEIDFGGARAQLGARFEKQSAESADLSSEIEHTGFSGSIGVNWTSESRVALGLSLARSVKFPTAEELFSNGPHLATNAFEVGDGSLDKESTLSADGTIRLTEGRLTGAFTVFMNRFSDFIFEAETGEERDGLRVFAFRQADATFMGYEAEAELEVFHRGDQHVALQAFSDYVRAELEESGEPLPRIPPLAIGTGVLYDGGRLHAHASVRRTTEQSRVTSFETETPGHTMVEASASYRFFTNRLIHEIILKGTNLTNEEARSHVSFLKDVAPFPGREIQLIYRLSF